MPNTKNNSPHNERKLSIPIKILNKDTEVPKITKFGDAGADARIIGFKRIIVKGDEKELEDIKADSYTLKPLERIGCPLGFATAIPEGYYFKVVPRSGLALWEGLSIVNSPGTIDSGYRNEWMAIVVNLSNKEVTIKKGERICQIILGKLHSYEFIETQKLPESARGLKGFGSTGKE
ncbi:MAG: dUTP diphosphatase [Candidatus Lokiarchaeota archaeon]|nr:dUTP diphosphatase [Candidatus Lokiarchaeota archaeon]